MTKREIDRLEFEELSLDHPLLTLAGGGEVGATGMGDNYHYTGEKSWYECMMDGMTGGGYQKTFLQAFASCTF
ncbi:hypothetical protein ACFJIX_26615 [Roseateles sp. UC29_93]|uniref:hypothetical protein n=1 Tax=Roseateles sp. UC29_93 TaxID=3350177 RepID=UPI00366E3C6D